MQKILIWPQCWDASIRIPFSLSDHGSELGYTNDRVRILEGICECWRLKFGPGQQFLPRYRTPGPGNLGIFHHFICWYRCSYMLPLEPPPYISLSFLVCQEGKGRWGVNRMPLWPCSARFTCPLHSKCGLFAFPPGVTPVLTGRWEPMCVPQVTQASLTDGTAGRQ